MHHDAPVTVAEIMDNFMDHDHGPYLHKESMASSEILYRSGDTCLQKIWRTFLPGLSLGWITWFQPIPPDKVLIYSVSTLFGEMEILHQMTPTKEGAHLHSRYSLTLNLLAVPLKSLIRRRIVRWNEKLWQEDLSLLVRRNEMLRRGFKDGVGLPLARPGPT